MDPIQYLQQNSRILQIYNIYRVALSLILLTSFFASPASTNLGSYAPQLFLYVSVTYCLFSFITGLSFDPDTRSNVQPRMIGSMLIVDILAVTLITYSGGGVASGLGLLLLMTVAAGGMLLRGLMSTFIAAIATISIIYAEVYLSLRSNTLGEQYMQVGLLGAMLFATSLYLQVLTERMRRSAALAEKQASSIVDLEKLNDMVIQRLRTGIIVLDATDNAVLTRNSAAESMLAMQRQGRHGSIDQIQLPDVLLRQLEEWKQNNQIRLPTFRTRKSAPQLQANFAYLNPESATSIVVFIEDNSQFLQRARQFKLASLGRLTASIAHEIRNPIGAISHATELLGESPNLGEEDHRFIEIILNHSARVNLIIEDILQMSRHQESNSEKINLYDWLEQFIEIYSASHCVTGTIDLEIRPRSTMVRVIVNQLEQILTNLFENGLRYSEKATGTGNLTIRGGCDTRNTQKPFLHIIDDGPGVSAAVEEHLFEPFYTTEAKGTGLGLYISKELCEANQAQLSYRKTRWGKSCFSIHFSHPDRNMN